MGLLASRSGRMRSEARRSPGHRQPLPGWHRQSAPAEKAPGIPAKTKAEAMGCDRGRARSSHSSWRGLLFLLTREITYRCTDAKHRSHTIGELEWRSEQ